MVVGVKHQVTCLPHGEIMQQIFFFGGGGGISVGTMDEEVMVSSAENLWLSNVKPGVGQKMALSAPPAAGCCQNARPWVEQNRLKAEPN